MNINAKNIYLLREAAQGRGSLEELQLSTEESYDALALYADSMLIGHDFYANLKVLGLDKNLSKRCRLHMEVRKHEAIASEKKLLAQLEDLASILNSAGVEFVLLKGAALVAGGYYIFPGQRFLSDIDFLVQKYDLDKVHSALCKAGYEPWVSLGPNLEQNWNSKHLPPYSSKVHQLRLECHHKQFESTFRFDSPFTPDQLFDSAEPITIGAARCFIPCAEHLMLAAFYHSEIFDVNGMIGRINYRAYLDFSTVANKKSGEINWDGVLATVQQKKYSKYFASFIKRLISNFDSSLSEVACLQDLVDQHKNKDRYVMPESLQEFVVSLVTHCREISRAVSSNGRKERKYIAEHNPDNWKYFSLPRQLATPSLLLKRVSYFFNKVD